MFILPYSDCPYLTALFAFCSYANPASIFLFLFLCLYCFVCSGWSRLPVFLNRGSCQCRCSNEYVQHVLQSSNFLKTERIRTQFLKQPQSTPDLLIKHQPHCNVQGTGSHPPFLQIPVPPPPPAVKRLICSKKLTKHLVCSRLLSWFTGSMWSGISHFILTHSVSCIVCYCLLRAALESNAFCGLMCTSTSLHKAPSSTYYTGEQSLIECNSLSHINSAVITGANCHRNYGKLLQARSRFFPSAQSPGRERQNLSRGLE